MGQEQREQAENDSNMIFITDSVEFDTLRESRKNQLGGHNLN